MTRQDLVTFDNDTTSCFDRQIPLFFLMVCQKFGMSSAICDIFAEVLHDMKYYIQNKMKLSEQFYCHIQDFLIFSSGQDNGDSALIWLFTSVFLMKVLQWLHQGMVFRIPDGKITNAQPIDAIVDDTMVGTTQPKSRPVIAGEAQALAQDWVDLLWLAGGMLELSKCYFYSILWD